MAVKKMKRCLRNELWRLLWESNQAERQGALSQLPPSALITGGNLSTDGCGSYGFCQMIMRNRVVCCTG
jgi:hypothetical protein